jgi:hypothetical protein
MANKPFTTVAQAQRTALVGKLTPVVDSLRDMLTQFGLRSYTVRIIKTRWTGTRRGEGEEYVQTVHEILPTPKLLDLSGIVFTVQPIGADEFGNVIVSEISPRFTEAHLRGTTKDFKQPASDEQVYYEIEFPTPVGQPGVKRRFTLSKPPEYKPGRFGWSVQLEKAREDRQPNGRVR